MSILQPKARRRLTVVLAVLLAASIGITALWFYRKHQLSMEYAAYKRDGLQAAQSGDNLKALDLLGKYFRRYSADSEVLIAYAQARQSVELDRQAHLVETMHILQRLLSVDPNHPAQRRQLLELYTKLGLTTEAINTATFILEQSPNDSEALRCMAQCQLRLQDDAKALAAAEKWAVADPNNIDAQMLILWLHFDLDKNADKSVELARKWSSNHPNDAEYETLSGYACMLANRPDDAKVALKAAAARNPQNAPLVIALVDKLDRVGLFAESLDLLHRADDSTKDAAVHQMYLRRLWQSGQYAQMLESLEKGLTGDSGQRLEQLAMKAVVLRRVNRDQEAAAAVAQIASTPGSLAAAWAMVPDFVTATAVDDSASKKMKDACLAALAGAPDAPWLRECLAEAYLQTGEPDLAISKYRSIVMEHPAWLPPQARLSDLLLSRGRLNEALQVAGIGYMRSHTVALGATYARALDASIQHGLVMGQTQLFDIVSAIQAAQPGEERTLPIYIRLLIEHGDQAKASAALRDVLAAPGHPSEQSLLAWAKLSRESALGLEDACITRLEKEHGITPTAAFYRAYALFLDHKSREGSQLLDAMQARAKPDAKSLVYWRLAQVRYLDLIQSPDAPRAWAKLADDCPDSLPVQESALSSPSNGDQREFLSRTIERVRTLNHDAGETWRLARARWYVMTGTPTAQDWQKATVLLNQVLRETPDSIEARFLLAQCLDQQNDLPQALQTLLIASRLEPDSRLITLKLAELLEKSGDHLGARQQLDRITNLETANPEQRRQAAILMALEGDAGKAAHLLDNGHAQSRPDEFILANLYYHLHDLHHAEELSDKLLKDPDIKSITLASSLYAAMGRISDAQRVLKQLDQQKLDHPEDRDLVLADFELRYGDKDKGLALLRHATAAAPKNPDTWRGLMAALLQRGQTDDALAAAQTAAGANANDAGFKAFLANKSLILRAMDNGLTPLAVGLVDASDSQPLIETIKILTSADATQPARTITQLEQLANRYPASLPVQIVVAERCIQMNRFVDAAEIAGRAAQAFPQAAEPAKLSFIALLGPDPKADPEQALWSQALGMARLWKDRSTDDTEEAECAIATCYLHLDDFPAALNELKPYPGNSADLSRHGQALAMYALLLYKSNRSQEAEQLLHPLLPEQPVLFAFWAQTVGAALPQEYTSHALDQLIARADATPKSQLILVQTIDAAAKRTLDKSHVPAADAICQALEAKSDLPADLLTTLAGRRNDAGNWEVAEKLYRRAIAAGESSGVAANNLAVLLAHHGQPDDAAAIVQGAIARFPNVAAYRDTLADIRGTQRKYDDAIASEMKAIVLQPSEPKWRIAYAELLLDAGHRTDAARAFSDWTELRQPEPEKSPLAPRIARLQIELKVAGPLISAGML